MRLARIMLANKFCSGALPPPPVFKLFLSDKSTLSEPDNVLVDRAFGGGESATAPLERSGAVRLFLLPGGLRKFCKAKTQLGMRFYSSEGFGFVIYNLTNFQSFYMRRLCHRMQCAEIEDKSATGRLYKAIRAIQYTAYINRIARAHQLFLVLRGTIM
jgi:hypothetical protein